MTESQNETLRNIRESYETNFKDITDQIKSLKHFKTKFEFFQRNEFETIKLNQSMVIKDLKNIEFFINKI